MRFGQLLKDTFSPYEIAIMGRVIVFVLLALAMAAWFPHPTRVSSFAFGIGAILFLLSLAAGLMWAEFNRCPICDKSLFHGPDGDVDRVPGWTARGRIWPERECSECGTALDIRP